MTEAEIIRLIKQVVRVELAQTLLATTQSTDNPYISSVLRFGTDSQIDGLRLIRPYGFASRPPEGTATVAQPINGDPTHLISLGDFDLGNRPAILDEESAMYGSQGQMLQMKTGGDVVFGDYVPATGTILPTFRAKFSSDGTRIIKNPLANLTLDPDGTATLQNIIGSIEISPTGSIALDGGTGATHGVGLGDVIETRLAALETALATLTTVFGVAHTHAVISIGSPTGPPLPPATPFVPVPVPAASLTVTVST